MENRANECTELDSLLKCLADWNGFKPGLIVHDDKPDFRITMPDRIIGVETTRLNCEEQVRAQKLHASKFPGSWGNLTGLKDNQLRRSSHEIIRSVRKHPTDPTIPWKKGSKAMLDWKDRVDAILKRKRLKYNEPEFKVFAENWLLIHQYPPSQIDAYTQSLAQQHLNEIFTKPEGVDHDFDTVFVHSGNYLFRWQKQMLSTWLNNKLVG